MVAEGIHALNPLMTEGLSDDSKFKIYISALTQINIDDHNRIPTTDGRLIRRIVRDARTRGNDARETIAMWPSVRRGEEKYIFPYQEEADVMFNSALIYELSVIKQYAEPLLFSVPKDCDEYYEAKRLLKFLDYFLGMEVTNIPMNSILREFVGGGCFRACPVTRTAVSSYLAFPPLPRVRRQRRFISVALAWESPPPDVIRHPAL